MVEWAVDTLRDSNIHPYDTQADTFSSIICSHQWWTGRKTYNVQCTIYSHFEYDHIM